MDAKPCYRAFINPITNCQCEYIGVWYYTTRLFRQSMRKEQSRPNRGMAVSMLWAFLGNNFGLMPARVSRAKCLKPLLNARKPQTWIRGVERSDELCFAIHVSHSAYVRRNLPQRTCGVEHPPGHESGVRYVQIPKFMAQLVRAMPRPVTVKPWLKPGSLLSPDACTKGSTAMPLTVSGSNYSARPRLWRRGIGGYIEIARLYDVVAHVLLEKFKKPAFEITSTTGVTRCAWRRGCRCCSLIICGTTAFSAITIRKR